MSLEIFKSEVEALRERASQLRDAHARETRDINSNPELSDAGKAAERDRSYNHYLPLAKDLREKEMTLVKKKISDLQSQLESRAGGTSTDIIAFRDAQDRADQLKDQAQALVMIERAMRQGDTSLAHAVFRRATEAHWPDVKNAFITEHPTLKDVVRELNWLGDFKSESFQRTMAYAIFGR
ncbi:hypothetical protein AB0N73_04065 [Microbacterium sp. NPDC089189]|uniref:hypothetical protein n=1 Tax=Microbacterium sp. NPDC089189 TaxID=3154972 RepID=UPI00342F5B32